MKKRLLAVALMLAMIISQMSIATFAAGDENASYDNYVSDLQFDYAGGSNYLIYSDDTEKTITVDTRDLAGYDYTLDCEVGIGYGQDEQNYASEAGSDLYSFDSATGTLTLNGSKLWNSVKAIEDDSDRVVTYKVYAVDQDQNVLGETGWDTLTVYEASASFDFYAIDKVQAGQPAYFGDGKATAFVYGKDSDGDAVELELKSAAFTDSSYGTVDFDTEEGEWAVNAVKAGKASIEYTFSYADDPDRVFEYTYIAEVRIVKQYDGICVSYADEEVFPGDDVELTAAPGDEVTLPENVRYEWSIDEEAAARGCSIEPATADNSKAILHIGDEFTQGSVMVSLVVYDADGEVFDDSINSVDVSTKFYKFFYEGFDEMLQPGDSMTITPVLKVKTSSDGEYSVVKKADGKDISFDVYLEYDGDDRITENDIAKITAEGGSYTITRKTDDFQTVHFEAYYIDTYTDEGELREEKNTICHQEEYLQRFDYYVSLDREGGDLFKESTLDVTASGIEGDGYTYEFELSKCTGKEKDEEGDDMPVFEPMDNSDSSLFTTDGNTVTLNGAGVWDAVKDGYIDEEDDYPRVRLSVSVKKNGRVIASDYTNISVRETTKYYNVEAEANCLINSSYIVDFDQYDGELLDAEHPYEGMPFSYTVTGVSASDETIAKVRKNDDEDCWEITGLKAGTTDLQFSVTDEFGEDAVISAKMTVGTDIYSIELDNYDADALPGDKVTFTAEGEHLNYKSDNSLNDFTYEWSIESGSEYVKSITPNKGKAVITIHLDALNEDIKEAEVSGIVALIDKNGQKQEEEHFSIFIYDSIKEYHPTRAELAGKNISLNTNNTVKPRVVERRIVDGAQKSQEITDFKWSVYYDPAEMQIKNSAGKIVQPDDYENLQSGALTVRRLTPDEVGYSITFYLKDEEDGEYYFEDSHWYDYDEIYPIKNASISNIKSYVYNGKAKTQAPKVVLWGSTLKLGRDYKLTYKNNKNVGLATVTITGIGNYYGSVNKTYKINPKGASLSKLTAAKKAFTVKWGKQAAKMATSRITGYQIQYSTNSKFKSGNKTVTVKGYNKVSRKISKLKAKKTYYVRIRTYKTVSKKNYYSAWSKVKKVKTK